MTPQLIFLLVTFAITLGFALGVLSGSWIINEGRLAKQHVAALAQIAQNNFQHMHQRLSALEAKAVNEVKDEVKRLVQ
jgi:hypothetical protein